MRRRKKGKKKPRDKRDLTQSVCGRGGEIEKAKEVLKRTTRHSEEDRGGRKKGGRKKGAYF